MNDHSHVRRATGANIPANRRTFLETPFGESVGTLMGR
jgi:hypothetical protein